MNVKEYAEANGMTQKAVKEKFSLTHWKQNIPVDENVAPSSPVVPDPPAKKEEKVPVAPVVPVKKEGSTSKSVLVEARALQAGIGDKTIAFLEFVDAKKDKIPEEYQRVKSLIKRFVTKGE